MSKRKTDGAPAAPTVARSTQEPAAEAGYFLSVSLHDLRCFGKQKQTVEFANGSGVPARWTILLGENGTGKTTVLQALVGCEEVPSSSAEGTGWNPRCLAWGREQGFFWPDKSSTGLEVEVARGPRFTKTAATYSHERFAIEGLTAGKLSTEYPEVNRPPSCYAYGASRRMGWGALNESPTDEPTATLFSDRAELRNAEEWLLQTDYAASKPSEFQATQKRRLAQVKELLLRILPDGEVHDIRFVITGGAWAKARVEFKTPFGWVPLRQLGYGYRTLIAWVVDFASRMVERYPDSPDPLAEPAVVLVDEIDLHLHPKWQRQLIGYLTERFPNTQFIATAHSPLIVQAANAVGANLAVLRRDGDHVVIENDPLALRGWSVNQLLTSELYDLPSPYPPQYDELFAQREALLSKEKLSKADMKRLERLDKQMGDLPLGDTAAQAKTSMLIRDTLKMLEEGAAQKS
jgi:hypothetical protein